MKHVNLNRHLYKITQSIILPLLNIHGENIVFTEDAEHVGVLRSVNVNCCRSFHNGFSFNESDLCRLIIFLAPSKWLTGPSAQPGVGCFSLNVSERLTQSCGLAG